MAQKDYYEILGVGRNATPEEIKKAYRALTRKYHPDLHPGDKDAEAKYKEINEAHEVLSDPQKKAQYDQFGTVGDMGAGGFSGGGFGGFDFGEDLGDIFGNLFGMGGRSRRSNPNAPTQGENLEYSMRISLEDAYRGTKRTVEITRVETCSHCHGNGAEPGTNVKTCSTCNGSGVVTQVANTPFGQMRQQHVCPTCHGKGKMVETPCKECKGSGQIRRRHPVEVTIPAGVDTGVRLRVAGHGNAGTNGGPSGDLFIMIEVADDSRVTRNGDDLATSIEITYPQAVLGCTVSVETLDGEEKLNIPPGTQAGSKLRIRGRGMPRLRYRGAKGDLIILVKVTVPKNPSKKEKEILKELAKEMKVQVKE